MHTIPLPDKDTRIFPGDVLGVIGTDEQIQRLNTDIEGFRQAYEALPVSECEPELRSIRLTERSGLIGKTLRSSRIRDDHFSMVVRVTDALGNDMPLRPDLVFEQGQTVWLVGDKEALNSIN